MFDPFCNKGGFSVYGSFLEISAVCNTSNYPTYRYKNIYSKSNEVLLVIYSYKIYGCFKINISLLVTKCKPVNINICAFTLNFPAE